MIKEICIIGHPSYCGGADTELLDQIKCWSKMGIKIYILHTGIINPYLKAMKLDETFGCIYLRPKMWNDCKGMDVISFCNGEFLSNLDKIKKHARSTTFVNCMTWNFDKEIECQSKGLIDFHLYQTKHAYDRISKKLISSDKPYRYHFFKPYFDSSAFPFYDKRNTDHFRFGRISRADLAKYNQDQFNVFDGIKSPVPKSGVVLGWDLRVSKKCRMRREDLTMKDGKSYYKSYIQLINEGKIRQQEFYKFCDVMIMHSDTFENLPRIGFECMASGTIPVVNNRGGWTLQVDNEKNGFLCNTTEEFIDRCNFLASNENVRNDMRQYGLEKLNQEWSLESSMKSWEVIFNSISNLK